MNHLPAERIAAYLDGTLDASERAQVDAHLADCTRCRTELRDARVVLRGMRSRKQTRRVAMTGLLAAGVAAVALFWDGSAPSPAEADRFRAGEGSEDAVATIDAAPPEVREEDGSPVVRLVWGSPGGAPEFRISVTDEGGATLWSHRTTDTTAVIPREAGLVAGGAYFWFVDAVLASGEAASTGVQEFRIP